jgi:hypothetical protein
VRSGLEVFKALAGVTSIAGIGRNQLVDARPG